MNAIVAKEWDLGDLETLHYERIRKGIKKCGLYRVQKHRKSGRRDHKGVIVSESPRLVVVKKGKGGGQEGHQDDI